MHNFVLLISNIRAQPRLIKATIAPDHGQVERATLERIMLIPSSDPDTRLQTCRCADFDIQPECHSINPTQNR